MTKEEVIDFIQLWIIANGNEEITADVLRPILEAMVNQPNDLIGDLGDLTTTYQTDLVGAINEINSLIDGSGLVIYTGTDLPDVHSFPTVLTPADFYVQLDGSTVLGMWVYNGNDWIAQIPQRTKTVKKFVSLVGVTVAGKSQVQWMEEAINLNISNGAVYECEDGDIIDFFVNISTGTTVDAASIRRIYTRLCTGATSVASVEPEDLMPDGWDDIPLSGELIVELEDIGTDDVWTAFNADPSQPFDMDNEMFVSAVQNSEPKLWQWIGGTGSFGSTGTPSVEGDFLDLTEQPVVPLGVETVTGYGVDNTDPLNPVIDIKPLVTADTGNEMTLYPFGNFCNSITPNLSKSFTYLLTDPSAPEGESATVLIKTEVGDITFPSVSMSDYIEGALFEENTHYDLFIWNNGNKTSHTFLKRPAVIEGITPKINVFDTATQTALSTIWWFTPYLASDFPELTFTKTYFFLYSSDHDAGDGGIYVGEGNELDLSDFVELGLVIDGYQTETPYLYRFPSNTRKIHLYYHTNAIDPTNGGIQRTKLISTNAGSLHDSTWTTETDPLGSEAGDQHLGYFSFFDNGTVLKGFHFKRGAGAPGYPDGTDQYSVLAADGLSSTRGSVIDRYYNLFGSSRYPQLIAGEFFLKYGQWWWIGNSRYTVDGYPDNPSPTDGGVRLILCKANVDFEITEFITELAGNGKYWFFYISGTSLVPGDIAHCYEAVNIAPSHLNYVTFDLTQLEQLV